ncbi:phage Gp37/Gp68 family protein [bacterium]|nr:phage Gp37/Gp68 family protein [bacterium]
MASKSSIEWTESTWNPVTGCSKISPGCENCYAERMAKRLQAMGQVNYRNGFELACHEHVLELPLKWRKPQTIFVNSMSDLFHTKVSISFIKKIFNIMSEAHWHQFQILTKRAERLVDLAPHLNWPQNVWMGVTIESPSYLCRLEYLRNVPASVRFLSMEPLLNAIPKFDLSGIDWVIVGGESGPGARPIRKEWVIDIHENCKKQKVPFFFKQWGGTNKKKAGRLLDGKIISEMPQHYAKKSLYHTQTYLNA